MAKTSEQIDRELAAAALKKRQAGEKVSEKELAALRRVEAAREEQQRWEYYRSIPQKHWIQMSGRQAKVINEQASRYGIPFDGATIDLPAVVRALHDFFGTHGQRLAELTGKRKPPDAMELLRMEKLQMARLDRLAREGQLLPRDQVHDGLAQIAAILRGAGETLARQYNDDARAILEAALKDCARVIKINFEGGDAEETD